MKIHYTIKPYPNDEPLCRRVPRYSDQTQHPERVTCKWCRKALEKAHNVQ